MHETAAFPAPAPAPALSLVVTTLGRVEQVERLFDSLAQQSFTDFDVLVVDQNDDNRLASICVRPWPFRIERLHTPGERGASRGRNRGWRRTRGNIVLFPDDDCWYPSDFLEKSVAAMAHWNCDIISGRAADETGRSINGRFEEAPQPLDLVNVWTTAIEWMVLFRRSALDMLDGFDDDIGIGAATPWQSCEIQDILIRALRAGLRCWYDPALVGHHEEMILGSPDAKLMRKAHGYARGMGFVLRLHGYGPIKIAEWVARPLASAAVSLARGRGDMLPYYGRVAIGRLEGALRRTYGN